MGLSTVVLMNPAALGPRGRRQWARWEPAVLRRLGPLERFEVGSAGEAEQAAWDAALAGFSRLVILGDLATVHGVVNGVMRLAESHRRALKIGVLSLARFDPWSRALNVPLDVDRQLDVLGAGHVLPVDAGQVECAGLDGKPVVRHFVTGAALGCVAPSSGGPVSAWWRAVSAATGALREHLADRPPQVVLQCDGVTAYRGPWLLGWAMQSPRYPGVGIVAAPASPVGGLVELRWIGGGVSRVAANVAGVLCRRPFGLESASAQEIRLDAMSGQLYVEADGVPLGHSPTRIRSIRRALPVIVEAITVRLREKQKSLLAEAQGRAFAGTVERPAPG